MNRLVIWFEGMQYIYFQTDEADAEKALNAFYKAAENAGIDAYQMQVYEVELRNAEGKTIARIVDY